VLESIAEVITIGNEVVSGRTVNTNASLVARRLTSMGFLVRRITAVRDDVEEISASIREALTRGISLLITTGGLGPTYDDVTAEALAKALGLPLELNQEALKQLVEKYKRSGVELTEARKKMALMPRGAVPVENNTGVAPGIYVTYSQTEILATPGVPSEVESVLEVFLTKYLKGKPSKKYMEVSFKVRGVMESAAAPHVAALVKKYFPIYITTHPRNREMNLPVLEVQIASSDEDQNRLAEKLEQCERDLKELFRSLGGQVEE